MGVKAWLALIGALLCIGAAPPTTQRASLPPKPLPEAPTAPAKIDAPSIVSMQSPQWWTAAARAEADQIADKRMKCLRYGQIMLAYAQTGDVTQAKDCLKIYSSLFVPGIRLPNQEGQVAALLIRVLSRSGRIDEAEELLAKEIPSARDHLIGAMAIGRALAGDLPAAFKAADSIQSPLRDRLYGSMARELIEAGNADDAQLVLDCSDPSVNSVVLRRRLAVEFARGGNIKAAMRIVDTFGHSSPGVQLIGRSLYGEMAHAAAAANKDAAGQEIVARAPDTDRQTSLAELGAGQVERGDLSPALATLNSLGNSTSAYGLRRALALAYARDGDYATAEQLDGNEIALELFAMGFDDLIKAQHLEAAAFRLDELSDDKSSLKSQLRFSLAVAMVMAGRTGEAADLYKNAKRDTYSEQIRLLIDTQYLQERKLVEYEAERQPLIRNVNAAFDGPPKQRAFRELWAFDFLTGNFKAADAEAESARIFDKGFVFGTTAVLAKRLSLGDFAYARDMAQSIPRTAEGSTLAIRLVSVAHIRAGRAMDLFDWIKRLPLARQRCDAYLAAAEALIPKPAELREF